MITNLPSSRDPHKAYRAIAPTQNRNQRKLRLGVLTPHNPYDQRAFSGTVFHAVRALAQIEDIDLHVIGPHQPLGRLDRVLRRPSPRFEPHLLAQNGSDFRDLDCVLGIVASPLLDAAALLTDLPMIHVTDATPGFLGEVYGKTIPASVHHREARVLARATAVYSSQMMAKRAAADFGRPLSRILSLPFGVNFKTLPPQTPKPSLGTRLNLLYVGGEWTRKGGTLMIESFLELRARGRNAHLTIVGHVPAMLKAELQARDDITLTGFLDKNRSHHLNRLSHMFAQAHLLVLPTRADCTPMVIAEALAHGTPVLASDVGGIKEMVRGGAGRVLPLTAPATDWTETLLEMGHEQAAYAMMADAARDRAETRLNWDHWARGIADLAAENLGSGIRNAA